MNQNTEYFRDDYESLIVQSSDLDKSDSLKTHPIFVDNPFQHTFLQHFSDNKGSKMQFISQGKGNLFDGNGDPVGHDAQGLIVGVKNTVDAASFTKVYHDALKLFGISLRASKLLLHIIASLKQNSLSIELDTDVLCNDMKMGKTTYYRAIKDLLSHNVIARTRYPYLFFINPVFIFNGVRIRVVKEYIKEGSVSADILSKNANVRHIGGSYSSLPQKSDSKDVNTDPGEFETVNSKAETEDEFGV